MNELSAPSPKMQAARNDGRRPEAWLKVFVWDSAGNCIFKTNVPYFDYKLGGMVFATIETTEVT